MRSSVVTAIACVVAAFAAGCSLDPSAREPVSADQSSPKLTPVTQTYRDLTSLPAPKGPIVAAVYGFRDQTGQYKQLPDSNFSTAVTQGATSMLVKALLDSRWFVPVEREGLQDLLTERRIIRANEKQKNGLPQLLSAQVVLQGGIVAYETNVRTGGAGARFMGIGASDLYRSDQVTVNLRAVDVRTGQVLSSVSTTKTIFSIKLDAEVFRFVSFRELLEVEVGYTRNEPSQLCVLEAIQAAVIHLVGQGIMDNRWQLKNPSEMNAPVLQLYLRQQQQLQAPAPKNEGPTPDNESTSARSEAPPSRTEVAERDGEAANLSASPDAVNMANGSMNSADALQSSGNRRSRNMLRRIDFKIARDGSVVLQMTLDRPLSRKPESFARSNPTRIWIDLPDTGNAVQQVPKLSGQTALRDVRVRQDGRRTRVVIDLATQPSYGMSVNGNVVSAVFEQNGGGISARQNPSAQTASR